MLQDKSSIAGMLLHTWGLASRSGLQPAEDSSPPNEETPSRCEQSSGSVSCRDEKSDERSKLERLLMKL